MRSILLILLIPITVNSDTTGNLITNGTFDNGTTGWTLTDEAQRIGDCCPGGHDLEFGVSGSIEQTFDLTSDDITTQMLDNGITLNSTVEVQNGEGGVGSWCPSCGGADSFRIDLTILDQQENILSRTTQTRNDVTGINGVDFTDSVTYTGTGSYYGNIFIKGEDASTGTLGGPNVDNISVTMTYDPTVLSLEQKTEINTAVEKVEEVKIEEYKFEEVKFTEVFKEEIKVEEVKFEEEIKLEEKEFIEETIVLSNEIIEEEVYEEEAVEETEVYTEVVESTGNTIEAESPGVSESTQDDSRGVETELTIEEISTKVAEKIKTIDGQLRATQMIVAKVMAKENKISSYSQVNTDIFIQPELQSIDIGTYTNNTYVDIRNIYPNQTYEDRLWTSRQ